MFAWLTRLIGAAPLKPLPPAQGPVVAAGRPSSAAAAVQAHAGVARRPLLGRNGAVAGFELVLPVALAGRLAQRGESAAAVAYHHALLAAAALLAPSRRVALLCLPAWVAARPGFAGAVPAGAMVCVEAVDSLPAEVARAWRQRGVLLGVPDGPPRASLSVDFVLLQMQVGAWDAVALSAQRWQQALPRVKVVVLGLGHVDDAERALASGAHLVGGSFGAGQAPAPRELGSAAHRICELLNHLALDRDTGVIAEAVRGDVALSLRLLRYANSPAIGLAQPVDTVEQAVLVLGRSELYRWLSVQLLSAAHSRQASRGLQETALARGRLLEGIARQRGEPVPGALFTLGMLSLIEALMQTPMAQALAPLRLAEPVRDALLKRQGPMASYLGLLDAIDAGDAAQLEALAHALGVQDRWADLNDEAWAWAAALV